MMMGCGKIRFEDGVLDFRFLFLFLYYNLLKVQYHSQGNITFEQ